MVGIPLLRPYSEGRLKATAPLRFYAGGGISRGKAKGETLYRPVVRGGIDFLVGDVTLRLMADSQLQDGLIAPSVGSALLVSVLSFRSFSFYVGGGARWYSERFDGERHDAWLGGPIGELRYALRGSMALFLAVERSWGVADAGHGARIDGLTIGLRR